MSPHSGIHVHIGPWINWSHGPILGATFTLKEHHGSLLIAFLAIYVAGAGAAIWRIISYAVHQFRANPEPSDGLHHQQQIIFRNVTTPGDAAWSFFLLPFYWSGHARRPIARSWPLILFALLNTILFGLAGVFSAEVTKTAGNETLIRSPNCGQWAVDDEASQQSMFAYMSKSLNDTIKAASYARTCYGNTPGSIQCSQFAQQQIEWTTNQNASCPFASGLCYSGDSSAYQMDTGPIDSHVMLGINAPPNQRITYRKMTTCSPINNEGYMKLYNNTGVDPDAMSYGDQLQRYYFGKMPGVTDYTYEYNIHGLVNYAGYMLTTLFSLGGSRSNTWVPIPALDQASADTVIFFLAPNSINYLAPVDDPFFSAHVEFSIPNPSDKGATNVTFWLPDASVHTMACIDQHQLCNPLNNQCTPLTSSTLAAAAIPKIGLTAIQLATATRFSQIMLLINTYGSVEGRGSSALEASNTVYDHSQGPLPNNQWQMEVSAWFAVSMAKLQDLVVQYATGPPNTVLDGAHIIKPSNAIEQAMCDSQKVRSSAGTISFSALGLAIILIMGSALLILNLVLDVLVGWVQKRFRLGEQRRLKWVLDEKFQLQRLAYEEVGMGRWVGGADAVPVTRLGDRWAIPEGGNPEHPRLGKGSVGDGYDAVGMGSYPSGGGSGGWRGGGGGGGGWGGTDGKGAGWDDRSSVWSGLLSDDNNKSGYTVEAVDLGYR